MEAKANEKMELGKFQRLYSGDYLMQPNLYYYIEYGEISSRLSYSNISWEKVSQILLPKYQMEEKDIIKYEFLDNRTKLVELHSGLIDLGQYCVIYFLTDSMVELLYSHSTDRVFLEEVKAVLSTCISTSSDSKINLVCRESDGLVLSPFSINDFNMDLALNYNDDLLEIDAIIETKLNTPLNKGIVLLHGEPGTGKTNYIRYLIKKVHKKMIYLPPDLAAEIANPSFLSFLKENPDSILIIEDAENLIVERQGSSSGAMSNLLNLCDGLLADCLNIQVVCTFNTDVSRIDKALLRKGRMIAKYEFTKLAVEKAQRLSDSLGFKKVITEAMNLTEIYNQDEKVFELEKPRIGF